MNLYIIILEHIEKHYFKFFYKLNIIMDIRIIYDSNIKKLLYHYNLIKNINIFSNNIRYIYLKHNKINQNEMIYVKYNIYIDIISEVAVEKLPCEFTILIVNEHYLLNNNNLRREIYIANKPLQVLDDYVNYYFCLTKYSYNIISKIVNPKKVYIMNGLLKYENIVFNTINYNPKYIIYNIDEYSKQSHIVLIKTWIKYFLNRHEILIIIIKYNFDVIVNYILELTGTKRFLNNTIIYYNNIIIFENQEYIVQYKDKIYTAIINVSNYSLVNEIYGNIIHNKFIITINNEISNEILKKNALYFNNFDEEDLYKTLNTFFSYDDKYILKCIDNNKKNINKNIEKTNKILQTIIKISE